MASSITSSSNHKDSASDRVVKNFLRQVLADRSNLRRGLANARLKTHASSYPRIASYLSQQALYRGLLSSTPFPKNFSDFKFRRWLGISSPDQEFMWNASVLSVFSAEISDFVSLKQDFEEKFICGTAEDAEKSLDEIENKVGISLWLIAKRLQLLQIRGGTSAQKAFLAKIVNEEGFSFFASYLSYHFSFRIEGNLPLTSLYLEFKPLLEHPGLQDFLKYQILPYDLTKITDATVPLSVAESFPVVDRFETFVSMAELQIARFGIADCGIIITALKMLEQVNDPRIKNLLFLSNSNPFQFEAEDEVSSFDAYTEGRYSNVKFLRHSPELYARARLFQGVEDLGLKSESIAGQIISSMVDVLLMTDQQQKARLRLQELALVCAHLPISTHIAAFLERTHDNILVKRYSELDSLSAVSGYLKNPWNSAILSIITDDPGYLDRLSICYKNSSSLYLQRILKMDYESGLTAMDELSLPLYRKYTYSGLLAYKNKKCLDAIDFYKKVNGAENGYINSRTCVYTFKALFDQGMIKECLDLVVDHYFANATSSRLYPLEELVNVALLRTELKSSVSLAIILHIASRQIHSDWERELSDVFENILYTAGITRPKQLIELKDGLETDQLIYLLRNICTIRILDDTTIFNNLEEIEFERIAICQHLKEFDPTNDEIYSSEIRSITRGANATKMLQQMAASYIYVDEDGIMNAIDDRMKGLFARYQQMLTMPDQGYDTKISERIGKLISNEGDNSLATLWLPSSERENLFSTMLDDFVTQFALHPAYGLKPHLSSSIRHGTFEGHVRTPLAAHDLLCSRSNNGKEFILPEKWERTLNNLSESQLEIVREQLGRFTSKIEELVALYLDDYLKIREQGANPKALFNFFATEEEREQLRSVITEETPYQDFLNKLLEYCWFLADRSMHDIRGSLRDSFLLQVNKAFDVLINSLETKISFQQASTLIAAAIQARTDFQIAIDNICDWFQKPTQVRREPFEFELAVDVALRQIENCYYRSPLNAQIHLDVPDKYSGNVLDGFVEIIFLLFQNIIRRSGFIGQQFGVTLDAFQTDSSLHLSVCNKVAPKLDLDDLKEKAESAMKRYNRDTAIKLAGQEGGSGLSKVWRVLGFDFNTLHELKIDVTEDRRFCVTLIIEDKRFRT